MKLILTKAFASNIGVGAGDSRAMKRTLNRLGYYTPPETIGLTDIPDRAVFTALTAFQNDHGLKPAGAARPGDATIDALNKAQDRHSADSPYYRWQTMEDDRVRSSHAALDGEIFRWDHPPADGYNPGEDYGCRCWAAAVTENDQASLNINDPPIEPVYPEILLLPYLKVSRGILELAIKILKDVKNKSALSTKNNLTEHGNERLIERKITPEEIQEAIKTAKKTNNVTTKTGKYGTPQIHYKGKNGVTVIVETTGRNAGKVITSWRNK